jgi:hypothetical protein
MTTYRTDKGIDGVVKRYPRTERERRQQLLATKLAARRMNPVSLAAGLSMLGTVSTDGRRE